MLGVSGYILLIYAFSFWGTCGDYARTAIAAVPFILAEGAAAYADYGMGRSRGTLPVQIAGNVAHGGLYETAFGPSLGDDLFSRQCLVTYWQLVHLNKTSALFNKL